VGTTKLTRKEILAEDPVHYTIIRIVEFFREQGKTVALVVLSLALLSVGVYFGLQYLERRDLAAQQELGKALELYHARIDPAALDDPYGKGPEPTFRTEGAKYQAANKAFSDLLARHGSTKIGVISRYYLGLCQLQLGLKNDAVQSLEVVRNNTKDRTLGYLAKKVLARQFLEAGNSKGAAEILDQMIKDPQCELPKEDLKLDLSRVYQAQGKREEAIKILRQARDEAGKSMLQSLLTQELTRLEGASGANLQGAQPPLVVRP
jgi:predicted negative regulator of RcsB-dependent stress response